jgi:hypothetical protein
MFEKDRPFVIQQVTDVLATYGVAPSGRGTGVGDVEYWADQIIGALGWEPYWPSRIGAECVRAGHTLLDAPPGPVAVSPVDRVLAELAGINARLDTLIKVASGGR